MNKIIVLSLIFIISLTIISCRTYLPGPKEKFITTDSLSVVMKNNGEFREATPGDISSTKGYSEIAFSNIGQSFTVKKGKSYQIVFDNMDFYRANIRTELVGKDSVSLTILDPYLESVEINSRCDLYNITGLELPNIYTRDGIPIEKIIIIPLFNDDCTQKGWQIRYGETERLKGFDECSKNDWKLINEANNDFSRCAEKVPKKYGIQKSHRLPKTLTEIIFNVKKLK